MCIRDRAIASSNAAPIDSINGVHKVDVPKAGVEEAKQIEQTIDPFAK